MCLELVHMKMQQTELISAIQHNCDISDARDHGIYSMCTMVLKLRNLYKWEHGIEPWEEPDPPDLLDWIDNKEKYWQTLNEQQFQSLAINGNTYQPDELTAINAAFTSHDLVYGFGYGRSMKAVFFVAEKEEERLIAGKKVLILGKELAKEMASPFAMAQDGVVYVRRENLRFFLWDHIQELRSSCRESFRHALELHSVLDVEGQLDQQKLQEKFDSLVESEMDLFIYHEIGELLQTTLDSATLQKVINTFPASVIELVCRSIKDILADTHPQGLLARVIETEKDTSLSFYIGFLDGLRAKLFPEIFDAFSRFRQTSDWKSIEDARKACRQRNMELARKVRNLADQLGTFSDEKLERDFHTHIVEPLGLEVPAQQ